jgi:hypothetical protein
MRIFSHYTVLQLMIAACGFGVLVPLMARETPHGRVRGTLLAAESGAALPGASVSLVRADEHEPAYSGVTDRRGQFSFKHVRVGSYSLAAKTYAHKQPGGAIEVAEGQTASAQFELEPTDPFLRLYMPQRVFAAKEEPSLRCHGFVPVNELWVKVYRVAPKAAIEAWTGSLRAALQRPDLETIDLGQVPKLSPVSSRPAPIRARDVEGVFRQEVRLGRLPPGMYLVAVEAFELRKLAALTVTDLGLVVKASPQAALVYAVDIESGGPVAGASVTVLRNAHVMAEGKTDNSGLLSVPLPSVEGGQEEGSVEVEGRSGDSIAITSLYYYWHARRTPLRVYIYTDRPVYRPGQKVFFRAIARELAGDSYKVPPRLDARVRVADPNENLVYAGTSATNSFGSLCGEFELSENALPGTYTVSALLQGRHYESSFLVAEYRKPEFEVTVTPQRRRCNLGDTIQATIQAQYYYGAPVPDAQVEYAITRSERWYYEEGEEAALYESEEYGPTEYEPAEYGEGGEIVFSGQGRTDENGRLEISFPAEAAEQPAARAGQDYNYTISAVVTDQSGRGETGGASVLVTQGEFRLEISFSDWVAQPEQKVGVTIRAIDYENQPVAGARGQVVLSLCRWQKGRERLYRQAHRLWQTDEEGRAHFSISPKDEGDYRLLVTTTDRKRNHISASAYLWVMSGAYSSFAYPYQDLAVQADRRLYREGDTAQIIVNTKHAPVTALLTIEGASVLEKRLVRLQGRSTVIKVKVRPEFLPAVWAKVSFVKAKQFVSGDALIAVSRERKSLRVQIRSDKHTYEPGERAIYRVKTLGPEGKPVQAEVSLGVVDEAIYAIAPESAPDILSYFYPKRPLEVETAFSFPEVYLSGDNKAAAQIRTRRFFPDTAFWRPATVTDANGEGGFEFTMPDNLTTWHATCRAVTLDTEVGQATQEAVVRKPFLVRLEVPRFFTQGDQVNIAAVAHNLTRNLLSSAIGLDATGVRVSRARTMKCKVGPGRTSRVEWMARVTGVGKSRIRTWARAGRLSDAMELSLPILPEGRERADVRSGAVMSKVELPFRISDYCIPGTQRLTVRLTPSLASAMLSALEYLAAYPYGCVEQTMSAFLPDVVIMQMLRELGVENRELRSRLPKMVEAGLLKLYDYQHADGGWGWWKYDETDPWMTAYVVFGLQQAEHAGFAVNDSALRNGKSALLRLAREEESGSTEVRQTSGGRRRKADADARVYMAYVLAAAGLKEDAGKVRFQRAELSDWGRAMLAATLAEMGARKKARPLLDNIWTRFSDRGFSPAAGSRRWPDIECAAALLSACCKLTPDDPRAPGLVRWMLARRCDNYWLSTRATAAVLYALSAYLLTTRELQPDMQATITIGGRVVAAKRFTAADVFRPEFEAAVPGRDLRADRLSVVIEKKGTGRLYYTASLNQVVAVNLRLPAPSASGIAIQRTYRKLARGAQREASSRDSLPRARYAFASGDVIEVTLTVRSRRRFEHIMVEDMLPAGCEARDRGRIDPWEWEYWWADQVVRDERVAFAVRELDPGVHRLQYRIYAQIPGRFTALSPQAYDMYDPAVRADGVAHTITIRP